MARFDAALRIRPDHLDTKLMRAYWLVRANRPQEFTAQMLAKLATQSLWATLLQVQLASQKNDSVTFEKANASLDRALSPTYSVLQDAWLAFLLTQGRVGLVRARGKRCMADVPQDVMCQVHWVRAIVSADDLMGETPPTLRQQQPTSSAMQLALAEAEVFILQKRFDEAHRLLQGIAQNVSLVRRTILLAKVAAGQGRLEDAIESLQLALGQYPDHIDLLCALGELAKMAKRDAIATQYFRRVLLLQPSNMTARLALASDYEQIRKAVRDYPWNEVFRYRLAQIEMERADFVAAKADLQHLLRDDPQHWGVKLQLIHVAIWLRDGDLVRQLLDQLRLSPDVAALFAGQLALRQWRVTEAIQLLTPGAHGKRGSEELRWLLRAYLEDNRLDDAELIAKKIASDARWDWEPDLYNGLVALARARYSSALLLFEKAQKKASQTQVAPVRKAEIYVALGRAHHGLGQLDEALAAYEDALQVCNLCVEPHHRRAILLEEQGEWQNAAAELKRCIELDPLNRELYLDLGRVFEGAQQKTSAAAMYRKYLGFNPPQELAAEVRQSLETLESEQ